MRRKSLKASEKGVLEAKQTFPSQRELVFVTSHGHQAASEISHILYVELLFLAATQTPSLTIPGSS